MLSWKAIIICLILENWILHLIGLIYTNMVPRGTIVNAEYIVGALKMFLRRLRLKRLQMVKEGFILHWDNAPVHTARIVTDFLATNEQIKMLTHPSYSLDLAS